MDTGKLDLVHDARDDDILAVSHGVDVELEGIFQETVDQHRMVG
jgi:hypothetical protein